jgi:hypothetical protein
VKGSLRVSGFSNFCTITEKRNNNKDTRYKPAHVRPSPEKPALQLQKASPFENAHTPFTSQTVELGHTPIPKNERMSSFVSDMLDSLLP